MLFGSTTMKETESRISDDGAVMRGCPAPDAARRVATDDEKDTPEPRPDAPDPDIEPGYGYGV